MQGTEGQMSFTFLSQQTFSSPQDILSMDVNFQPYTGAILTFL